MRPRLGCDVNATSVTVSSPDVYVNGDGVIVLELVRVDDIWTLVNDRSVTVAGVS